MNNEKENLTSCWLVRFFVVVVALPSFFTSGCAYDRATEDGAFLRWKSEIEIFPSGSSDDKFALSNKAVETTTENADKVTNAHDAGIKKTRALTQIITTTTTGPSREHIRN